MPSFNVSVIKENAAYDLAWRSLRRYHDTETSVAKLMRERDIPASQKKNVQKQMQQMSYSLAQAYEFSRSARSSGVSTKALQAYYSLTSLANAEILWRGDGNVSIERREGTAHRHGLDISVADHIENCLAEPQLKDGEIVGLFGLWLRYARHVPHYGKRTTNFQTGTTQYQYSGLSSVTPLSEFTMPRRGLSLADCLAHIPGMQIRLAEMGRRIDLVRARLEMTLNVDEGGIVLWEDRETIIHPCSDALCDRVIEKFIYHPALCEDVTLHSPPSGAMFRTRRTPITGQYHSSSPEAFSHSTDDIYFVGDGDYLNEVGYFYVGLYIIGMITRYHPQLWIKEINRHSEITLLIDEFVDLSLVRAPLLTLGQIKETIYVYDQ